MHRLGSLGCYTGPSDPRVDERGRATCTRRANVHQPRLLRRCDTHKERCTHFRHTFLAAPYRVCTRVGKSMVLLSRFHTYKGTRALCFFLFCVCSLNKPTVPENFFCFYPPASQHVSRGTGRPRGGYTSVLDERARVGAACLCHVLQLRAGDALCLEHSLHGGDILERRNG